MHGVVFDFLDPVVAHHRVHGDCEQTHRGKGASHDQGYPDVATNAMYAVLCCAEENIVNVTILINYMVNITILINYMVNITIFNNKMVNITILFSRIDNKIAIFAFFRNANFGSVPLRE